LKGEIIIADDTNKRGSADRDKLRAQLGKSRTDVQADTAPRV
jgi:hypothetical protein